jgi:hypothetical protein
MHWATGQAQPKWMWSVWCNVTPTLHLGLCWLAWQEIAKTKCFSHWLQCVLFKKYFFNLNWGINGSLIHVTDWVTLNSKAHIWPNQQQINIRGLAVQEISWSVAYIYTDTALNSWLKGGVPPPPQNIVPKSRGRGSKLSSNEPWRHMGTKEVNGEVNALPALPLGRQPPVPTGEKAELSPELVWSLWREAKSLSLLGIQHWFPGCPVNSLVPMMTQLS